MANLKLPRLPTNQKLVERDGTATMAFALWWQSFAKKIEDNINGINAALAAAAAAQATADLALAGVSVPTQTVTLGVGTSTAITFSLDPGITVTFDCVLEVNISSGAVGISTQLQYALGTGGYSSFGTNTTDSGSGGGTDLHADSNGTITNSTGNIQVYSVRAVGTKTGAGTYTTTTATSLLRGPT